MATPLRYALIFLLWAMVAVIYAPLIPATHADIACFIVDTLAGVVADPQLPQALLATLVSTTIAAVGALLIALLVIVALWPGPKWQRMCARLPWLLAIPHVALPPAPFCSLLTEGCFMTISRISLRQWTNWVLGWASPGGERKRISAVDLSGSIERKTAVAASYCAGFTGLQPLAMFEVAAFALCRACAGNGDAGDCSPVAVGRGCGDYPWAVIPRRWQ